MADEREPQAAVETPAAPAADAPAQAAEETKAAVPIRESIKAAIAKVKATEAEPDRPTPTKSAKLSVVGPAAEPKAAPKPTPKAPGSWKVAGREVWEQIPDAARAEILRREQEIGRASSQWKENQAFRDKFNEVSAPYQAIIAAEGGDALKSFATYLQTSAALRTAPPDHKARLVSQVAAQFQVPIDALLAETLRLYRGDVRQLDAAVTARLRGAAPAAYQPQGPQQFRDPRLDELLKQINESREQGETKKMEAATKEVEEFEASHPYLNEEIKDEMATLIEAYDARGKSLSIPEAHDLIAARYPEIQKIVEKQRRREEAEKQRPDVERARRASSTIRSRPVVSIGSGERKGPISIRDSIRDSIAKLQSQG